MINTLPQSLIDTAKKILTKKTYYRGTDNPNEKKLIEEKSIRPSINHITGKPEKGLSVSDVPSVSKYFNYMYSLTGDEIGSGSDGEPLLSLESVKFIKWIKSPDNINESLENPMIDVDGEMKHKHNSNGQPIHHTDEGIRNFHRWFGKSKTVDEHGRPQVFYHGTDSNFDEFKKTHGTISTVFGSDKVDRHGHFFTDDKYLANTFSKSGKVMSVYLKAHHPLDMRNGVSDDKLGEFENHGLSPRWFTHSHMEDWERFDGDDGKDFTDTLNKMGHDSVIIHEPATSTQKGGSAFVVFHPHQIKSSESNTGEFSPNKNRITESTENRIREEHYNLNFWKRDAKKFGLSVSYNQKTNSVGKPILEEVEVWFAEDNDKKCHGIFFKGGGTNYGHLIHEKEEETPKEILEAFFDSYQPFTSNHSFYVFENSLDESFDTKYHLYDMTDEAYKQKPEIKKQNDEYNIRNYKVEFHPETRQIFTTYHRDGAWEIHHQKDDTVGEELKSKSPPMGFSGHVLGFIKDKLSKNEKVRINGTKEMIPMFHKKASRLAPKLDAGVTQIEKGVDPHRTGLDIHEFLIYPNRLKESLMPLQFINPHDKIRFLREHFPESSSIKEYEERLKKQGHQL